MRLGSLNITCKCVGSDKQPWTDHRGAHSTVFKYKVTVSHSAFKSARYTGFAWGSIHDYERGKKDDESIGAMVVDELLSAASDPDEFITMVMGDATGREALKRGANAEKVIKAAKKFRHEELSRAVEEAQEKGLL